MPHGTAKNKQTDKSLKLKTSALLETVQKMKKQATDLEKILAKHFSDKGLVSEYIEKLTTH